MSNLDELAGPHEQWCIDYAHGGCCGPAECDCGRDERRDAIAAALAVERENARAPFLALADDMEFHDAELCSLMAARKSAELDLMSEAAFAIQAADLRMDAKRIRRVAEADQ